MLFIQTQNTVSKSAALGALVAQEVALELGMAFTLRCSILAKTMAFGELWAKVKYNWKNLSLKHIYCLFTQKCKTT